MTSATISPSAGRRRLAVLLASSSLLGGGATAGVLAATGSLGGSTRTTVIQAANAADTTSAGDLDAQALYAANAPGVVDIAAGDGTGTGFVIDDQGRIVTAAHVVDGSGTVTVTLQDRTRRDATVLGTDDATDVAVLKIDPAGLSLHPVTLGSSASLGVGAEVAVIGDPFGYARSISTGIVSGVDRTIEAPNGFTVAHAIQTDAALNPGNSGGPVFDAAGRVVGIADQIATGGSSEQGSGVGFAVPIDLVKRNLETLAAGGAVRHAYLGVGTGDGTGAASIASVVDNGPAAAAGLRPGDTVVTFGGTAIRDADDLVSAIAEHQPGDRVPVTVRRGGRTIDLTVTLASQPEQAG